MAKPAQIFVALMIIPFLFICLHVHGSSGAGITTDIPVPSRTRILQKRYSPQTTVSKQCNLCDCCPGNNDTSCYVTTCCYKYTCNDPAEPDGTCTVERLYCGCDEKTCK
uniref:Uncharacterized protein n=1 Tax=Avena sativa TaxID=4498 RepID=A0ACD5Y4B2_AVESA